MQVKEDLTKASVDDAVADAVVAVFDARQKELQVPCNLVAVSSTSHLTLILCLAQSYAQKSTPAVGPSYLRDFDWSVNVGLSFFFSFSFLCFILRRLESVFHWSFG